MAIFCAALAVYANTLWNGFVWDDFHLIVGNPAIKRWAEAPRLFTSPLPAFGSYYRPLQVLSFLTDYQAWGLAPAGFHLTSLVLHAATAVLLYRVAAQLLRDPAAGAIAGLLFAVHPVNTEAVTYLSGRSDPLSALCMLAALSSFLSGGRVLSLAAFLLALLARESAMVCLLLIVLVDVTVALRDGEPVRRDLARRAATRYLPYAVVLAAYLAVRSLAVSSEAGVSAAPALSLATRLLTLPKVVVGYLVLLALPVHLHMERAVPAVTSPFDPAVLGSVAALIALGAGSIAVRRSAWPVTFGAVWFVVALLPVANIFPLAVPMAEHWLYVPAMGIFIAVGHGLGRLAARAGRWPAVGFVALLLVAYGARSVRRNADWRDQMTLFNATLRFAPDNARVLTNLGLAYLEGDRADEAKAAFARAIALRPADVEAGQAHLGLGTIALREGRIDDAVEDLQRAVALRPNHPAAYASLALALQEKERLDDARRAAERAIAIDDRYAIAHVVLGNIVGLAGDLERARREYLRAISLDPDNADAYANLGSVYLAQGLREQAVAAFRTAIRLHPDSADTRRNLEDALRAATTTTR